MPELSSWPGKWTIRFANIPFHCLVEKLDKCRIHQHTAFECIQEINQNSSVLFPRVVGHSTPETGNHFILWVLNGLTKEIMVYDSMRHHMVISPQDMDILSRAFEKIWKLKEWTVTFPNQWRQEDSVNCGVFVCTAADLYIRGLQMKTEALNQIQLGQLRVYHATSLMADVVPKGQKVRENCMVEVIHGCIFYDSSGKGQKKRLYPHTNKENWINTMNCLHKDGVQGLISEERIKTLKDLLDSGKRKSQRMFLWENPGQNIALKQILNGRPLAFSEKHMEELIDRIKTTLKLNYNDLRIVDYIIDVMVPEVTIDILMTFEGITRYQAEKILGTVLDA
ncbi:uncharacterized protein LOC121647525 [Melanotaenia boesemani]|uniref:uncharacterized protein LOC121647525 n=1 Tax=Melanotaenia boesemani TaxID=1250792 RepID=UPI001C05402B|nr:uncharacterized protein LOC121647525 [Melanotaenia boesemani]